MPADGELPSDAREGDSVETSVVGLQRATLSYATYTGRVAWEGVASSNILTSKPEIPVLRICPAGILAQCQFQDSQGCYIEKP